MAKQLSVKERLKKKREELSKNKGSFNTFIFPKEGVYRMRPLPVPPDQEFAVEAVQFYVGGEVKAFISPATFDLPCAVMEWQVKMTKSKKEEDRERAKKLNPRKVYLSPHLRYNDEKGKEPDTQSGAKLVVLKGGQYQDLIDLWMDEDEAGDFTDAKTGYDIKYTRTGTTQFDTEYTVRACKPTPLPKAFAKQVYDPIEMTKALIPTYEQTQEYLAEYLASSGAESDSKPSKKSTTKKKASTKAPVKEEAPIKKKKKKVAKGDLPF